MNILLTIIAIFIVVPIVGVIIYTIVMLKKDKQFPILDFQRFSNEQNIHSIKELEQVTNKSIKGTEGWILLTTFYMSAYYLLNIWSILFVLLNLFVIAYYNELALNLQNLKFFIILFSLLSASFTFLDNWLDSKEKSRLYHKNWFKTSVIAKKFIVTVQTIYDYDELCHEINVMIASMHEQIKDTKFL